MLQPVGTPCDFKMGEEGSWLGHGLLCGTGECAHSPHLAGINRVDRILDLEAALASQLCSFSLLFSPFFYTTRVSDSDEKTLQYGVGGSGGV